MDKEQLEFVVFCIENFADKHNIDAKKAYAIFKKDDNFISNYIIKNYGVLHSQGLNFIVNDLNELANRRGITIC